MRERKRFRRAVLFAAAVVALETTWARLELGGEFATTAFSDLIGIPTSLAAAWTCFVAAQGELGRTRRGWLALGWSMASWGVGEAIWSYYELVSGREVPFPSLADVGFLALIPFGVVAMLSFPTAPRSARKRLRAILDGFIIAGSVLFVAWAFVLGPAYAASSGGLLEKVIGLAYPVGDTVIIAIVLYVMARASNADRFALGLIALGLASIAFADAGFTYLTLYDLYESGSWIDPFWTAGFLLVALAALRKPRFAEATDDERRIGVLAISAPYIPFASAVAVAVYVQVTRGALSPFLFWNAIIVVLALGIRQMLALLDNIALNHELERRVEERTEKLERALVEIEDSKRLQDEFVANTSHELLTPLTVIAASLEMLEEPEEDTDHARCVEMAKRAVEKMKRLIEDILLTSGVTAHIGCSSEPFDATGKIIDTVQSLAKPPGRVQVHTPNPLLVVADAERFGLIVKHLISDADKYAPEQTPIYVEGNVDGNVAHIVVADEGPGIAPDQRTRVFDRFYQVDGSDTRSHGGVGLGLFVARELAIAMGGGLDIDDTAHGACLHLVLPARVATSYGQDEARSRSAVAPHSSFSGAA